MKLIALRDGMTVTIWADKRGAEVRFAGRDDAGRPFSIIASIEEWERIARAVEEAIHDLE